MEERLIGESYGEPPNSTEVAQKSNSEKIRYNQIYNNCIWSSKHCYGYVYNLSARSRELYIGIHPTRGLDYSDPD